jgi:cytochrome c-type biogenesis protein
MNIDPGLLQPTSLLGYVLVFLGGLVTSLGPCNLATVPLIVAYVGRTRDLPRGRSFALSFAFTLGLVAFYMVGFLGLLMALLWLVERRNESKLVPAHRL